MKFATGTYQLPLGRRETTRSTTTFACHRRVEEPRMQHCCSANVLFATSPEARAAILMLTEILLHERLAHEKVTTQSWTCTE
jgi:hypothetical protein